MFNKLSRIFVLLASVLLVSVVSTACSSKNTKDIPLEIAIEPTAEINPDHSGEPKPVRLSIYYLSDHEKFEAANFFDLFGKEKAALGPTLLRKSTTVVLPGKKQNIAEDAPLETKAIGVVAAFRDVDNANWKSLVLTPESCFLGCKPILKKSSVLISVDEINTRVELVN